MTTPALIPKAGRISERPSSITGSIGSFVTTESALEAFRSLKPASGAAWAASFVSRLGRMAARIKRFAEFKVIADFLSKIARRHAMATEERHRRQESAPPSSQQYWDDVLGDMEEETDGYEVVTMGLMGAT